MKTIALTGGKGGTGKSTIATALAVELAKTSKVLLADLDVDCPDDHYILKVQLKKFKDIFLDFPKWDFEKCIKCGKCAEVCREKAIVHVKEKYPVFIESECTGCTACMIACPVDAISSEKKKVGEISKGSNYGLDLVSGTMKIGFSESSPIVNAAKKEIEKIKSNYDYVIIDTGAGTHCNVISALIGVEKAYCVTEPTPLGEHDLGLILDLLKELKIESKIVLNKAGIGKEELIKNLSEKHCVEIVSRIEYSRKIVEDYSKGIPIQSNGITQIIEDLKK